MGSCFPKRPPQDKCRQVWWLINCLVGCYGLNKGRLIGSYSPTSFSLENQIVYCTNIYMLHNACLFSFLLSCVVLLVFNVFCDKLRKLPIKTLNVGQIYQAVHYSLDNYWSPHNIKRGELQFSVHSLFFFEWWRDIFYKDQCWG